MFSGLHYTPILKNFTSKKLKIKHYKKISQGRQLILNEPYKNVKFKSILGAFYASKKII